MGRCDFCCAALPQNTSDWLVRAQYQDKAPFSLKIEVDFVIKVLYNRRMTGHNRPVKGE